MTFQQIEKKVKEIKSDFNTGKISAYQAFKETKDLGVKKPVLEKELRNHKNLGLVTRDQANDIEKLINNN